MINSLKRRVITIGTAVFCMLPFFSNEVYAGRHEFESICGPFDCGGEPHGDVGFIFDENVNQVILEYMRSLGYTSIDVTPGEFIVDAPNGYSLVVSHHGRVRICIEEDYLGRLVPVIKYKKEDMGAPPTVLATWYDQVPNSVLYQLRL
jgi:hypothetical protein